jgi:hypothetical protein
VPAVVTVRVDVPVLLTTETAAMEHAGAGLGEGEILQVRVTPEGLRPLTGLIVIFDCAEFPGATESASGAATRLKSGAVTIRLATDEALLLKLPSPL